MSTPRQSVDPVDDAMTDLEGILHALDIIRHEDVINKPGPEFYALAVLIPLAIEKCKAARQAMEDEARAKVVVKQREVAQ
jgi:hypothetical protein